MDRKEILYELSLPYNQLVYYLQDKYGIVQGNYFITPTCATKNKKIMRSKEGLFCHHIKEDEGGNLSQPDIAKQFPYEWQCSYNLVYCNYLEHLILHMKVSIIQNTCRLTLPIHLTIFFSNAASHLSNNINDIYLKPYDNLSTFQKNCLFPIRDNYDDYILLLKLILYYTTSEYMGRDKTEIGADRTVVLDKKTYKVLVCKNTYEMGLQDKNRQSPIIRLTDIQSGQLLYLYWFNEVLRGLSKVSPSTCENGYSEQIYKELLINPESELLRECAASLKKDFSGYKTYWNEETNHYETIQ